MSGSVITDDTPFPVKLAKAGAADPLICMPFRGGAYQAGAQGAASVPSIGGSFPENDDGTGSGLFCSVPASSSYANAIIVDLPFWGNVFGLRLVHSSSYGGIVGLFIDEVAYPVDNGMLLDPWAQTNALSGMIPGIQEKVIADDLGDGPHWARIVLPAKASGTSLTGLLGYLVEARAGYRPPSRGVSLKASASSLTAATWTTVAFINSDQAYGTRKYIAANNIGTTVTAGSSSTVFTVPNGAGALWAAGSRIRVGGVEGVVQSVTAGVAGAADTITLASALPFTPPAGTQVDTLAKVDVRYTAAQGIIETRMIWTGDSWSFDPGAQVTHTLDFRSSVAGIVVSRVVQL